MLFRSGKDRAELDLGLLHLGPGSHSSPKEGVCVVELASLVAGERFSDRPRCVCRLIAAYLRALNDRVSHHERQKLRPFSVLVLDSRANRRITRRRRDLCLRAAGARLGGGPGSRPLERMLMRLRILAVLGPTRALWLDEGAGEYAARVVFARGGYPEAVELLKRLLGLESQPAAVESRANGNGRAQLEAAPLAHRVQGASQPRVAAAIRELAGESQVAEQENGRKHADHNGHSDYLSGGDTGQGDEEGVESDHAGYDDPERDSNLTEELHPLPR
jgi:hypothetical protein